MCLGSKLASDGAVHGRLGAIAVAAPTVFRHCCAHGIPNRPAAPAKKLQRFETLGLFWRCDSVCSGVCHRPANMTASGPGGVIQKKSRKISNGQRGLPRRPGSSPAVEDGASQGAHSDERSSLALDWRWPLPQRTERIVSMNSVSGSVPPVPTRSVGPVHDTRHWLEMPSHC